VNAKVKGASLHLTKSVRIVISDFCRGYGEKYKTVFSKAKRRFDPYLPSHPATGGQP
jgi:hypothetical protein